jgi:mono/diheme cytochrome c family protein
VLETSSASASGPDAAVGPKASYSQALRGAADRRVEGEKRFHANCGRCHMAPHKFPPRMMATIERHMRVRAMITAEDMQLILGYMTE